MKLFLIIATLFHSALLFADEPAPAATTPVLERFENHPVKDIYKGKPAKVDFAKNPRLREYRTALSESIRQGTNFAGQYRITEVGCGTSCQLIFILNTKTGRSVQVDKASSVGEFSTTCAGALYQPNSNLLILNPPDPEYPPMCPPEQYLLIDSQLKRLK